MAREFELFLPDSDGTLLDTQELIIKSFQHSFETHFGLVADPSIIRGTLGKPLSECYRLVGRHYRIEMTDGDVGLYCQTHDKFQNQNLHLAQPFPGTVAELTRIKESGVKTAVITSRTMNARLMLTEAGIMSLVDFVVTGDDVAGKFKPAPDGINLTLSHFDIPTNRAIMMGDTAVDVLAGRNAGTKTIGVTWGSLGPSIADLKPDFVLDSVTQISPLILRYG